MSSRLIGYSKLLRNIGSYVLYMKYFNVYSVVKKSADYKKNQVSQNFKNLQYYYLILWVFKDLLHNRKLFILFRLTIILCLDK